MNFNIPSDNTRNRTLKLIMEHYLNQVVDDSKKEMDERASASAILVLSEAYPLLSDQEEADGLIYQFMKNIRNTLESSKLHGNASLYGGLADIGLSVYSVYQNTGNYKKFLDSINQLYLEWVTDFTTQINLQNGLRTSLRTEYFDAIWGLSGMAKYLLLYEETTMTDCLKTVLKMLVSLCGYKKTDRGLIPRWHIKCDNLTAPWDQEQYPEGWINYSIAHGIAAPLVVLSDAYKKGIRVQGQLEAIRRITDEYTRLAYVIDGSVYWRGMLSPREYLVQGKGRSYTPRESWCYGAVSIARALFSISHTIEDKNLSDWSFTILEQKALLKIEDYRLISPTLCHGYAGVLSILYSAGRICPSPSIIKGTKKMEDIVTGMYDPDSKYGFYDIDITNPGNKEQLIKTDQNTFLDGSAGILLSLLAAHGYGNDFYLTKLIMD